MISMRLIEILRDKFRDLTIDTVGNAIVVQGKGIPLKSVAELEHFHQLAEGLQASLLDDIVNTITNDLPKEGAVEKEVPKKEEKEQAPKEPEIVKEGEVVVKDETPNEKDEVSDEVDTDNV